MEIPQVSIAQRSMEASRFGTPIWWDTPRPNDLVEWAKAGCPTTKGQPHRILDRPFDNRIKKCVEIESFAICVDFADLVSVDFEREACMYVFSFTFCVN